MALLNRIKNAAKAFKAPEEISHEELKQFLEEPVGDGKGEFLPDMNHQEYLEYLENEENGWGKFKRKILGI